MEDINLQKSFGGDEEFVKQLNEYLNENEVHQILRNYFKPYENTNINRKTGRPQIGVPSTRPRKILREGSLRNYKSIILKFCKFKYDKVGKDAPITTAIIEAYSDQILNSGYKKYQTIVTEIRVLNKNVIVPLLEQELPKPKPTFILARAGGGGGKESDAVGRGTKRNNDDTNKEEQLTTNNDDDNDEEEEKTHHHNYMSIYCNKPQFTHIEIALTMLRIWKTCKNRDHVHKVFLIYYTGLRAAEAQSLTFKDMLDSYTKTNIIIPIRRGKGRQMRNVILFKGAPDIYFRRYLLPYLKLKMANILKEYPGTTVRDHLNKEIFSESTYAACRKAFHQALLTTLSELEKNETIDDIKENIKGAGLHSLRADWTTRTLKHLVKLTSEPYTPLKITAQLLGHRLTRNIINHYLNLGNNFDSEANSSGDNNNITSVLEKYHHHHHDYYYPHEEAIERDSSPFTTPINDDIESFLFKDLKYGSVVKNELRRSNKSHYNLKRLFNVLDDNYIIHLPPPPPPPPTPLHAEKETTTLLLDQTSTTTTTPQNYNISTQQQQQQQLLHINQPPNNNNITNTTSSSSAAAAAAAAATLLPPPPPPATVVDDITYIPSFFSYPSSSSSVIYQQQQQQQQNNNNSFLNNNNNNNNNDDAMRLLFI